MPTIARESLRYTSDLLGMFGCPVTGLRAEQFPLEGEELPLEHRNRYGKIVLCEILEHLAEPETALRNMRAALHPEGTMFATMAINIAQEDHVFLYNEGGSPCASRPRWSCDRSRIRYPRDSHAIYRKKP